MQETLLTAPTSIRNAGPVDSQQELLRLIVDRLPVLIAYVDRDEVYRFCNRTYIDWYGVDPTGLSVREFLGELAYERVKPYIRAAFAGQSSSWRANMPYRLGPARDVAGLCLPDVAPDGSVRGYIVRVQDITEQQRLEVRLEAIFSQVSVGILESDLNGRLTMVNDRFCEMLGRRREVLLGMTVTELTHPDDLPACLAQFERMLAGGPNFVAEKRYLRPDGSFLWVESTVSLTRDPAGKPRHIVAIAIDTTERRKAQQELLEREERYRALSACSPVGIFVTDTAGKLTYVNPRCEALCGFSLAEGAGDGWLKFVHEEDAPSVWSGWQQALAEGREHSSELRFVSRGKVRWVHARAAPYRTADGRPMGYVGTVEDITERKLAEETLRRNELIQREFVANVSHDFRTPIAAIKGYAETLLRGALKDPKHRLAFTRTIWKNAERLGSLVEDILLLSAVESQQVKPQPECVPLGDFVGELLSEMRPIVSRRRTKICLDIPARGEVWADRGQLGKIISNLISNAVKYGRHGGRVLVRARRRRGGKVLVEVRDNGVGIAPEHQSRIFERFYRVDPARPRQAGATGLGLHIVKELLLSSGNDIWVKSRLGRGSSFFFTLDPCR